MPSLSWLLTAPKQHLFGLGSSDNGLLSAPVCLLPPSKELELREQAAPQGESIWQGQLVELRSAVRSLPVRESGTMSLETGGALLCNKSSLSSYTKSRRHRAARVVFICPLAPGSCLPSPLQGGPPPLNLVCSPHGDATLHPAAKGTPVQFLLLL